MKDRPSWVSPFSGELLTAWLARVAIQGGTSPLVLTGRIWPKWRMWTQDADRGLRLDRLEAAANWFELPKSLIEETTLRRVSEVLQGPAFPLQSTWPWVVALGSRNRLRKAGLPCCPQCLAETSQPYFRSEWRLAWTVGCVHHGTRLIDRCTNCMAAIEPHRNTASSQHLACCVRCYFDLRNAKSAAVDGEALSFQLLASKVLQTKVGLLGDVEVPQTVWFQRMRRLVVAPPCKLSEADSLTLSGRHIGLCIEMQCPQEREFRLRNLVRLLNADSGRLFCNDLDARISSEQADVARKGHTEKCRRQTRQKSPIHRLKVEQDWARWLRRHRIW